jgi:hypothetical protein
MEIKIINKMKYRIAIITLLFTGIFAGVKTYGQGCSDAGVCTVGIMSGDEFSDEEQEKIRIGLGYNIGQGDAGTMVNTILLEGNVTISSRLFVQFKIPYLIVDGNLGKTNGLGDITLSVNGILKQSGEHRFEGFAGFRVGTGNADLETGGKPLPMVYQTGLGTTDLLLGAKWFYKGWSASLGYQQPLIQYNKNQFLYSAWEGNPDANSYDQTRDLKRKSDIVARLEKSFYVSDLTISLGLVPIYHLQNDTYENSDNVETTIDGSQGLTLNVSGSVNYQFSPLLSAAIFYGSPLVTRDSQPEGLGRKYVAGLGVYFNF